MSLLMELDSSRWPNYKDISPTGFETRSPISKAGDPNQMKFCIHNFIVLAIVVCSLDGCSRVKEPADLTKITPGYQTVGDRGVLYKAANNQFLWGIILPSGESLGTCFFSPEKATANLQSGIFLQLVNNSLTISNSRKSVTIDIKTNSIYLLNSDLKIYSSENLSGIQLVPRKQWSRDSYGYVTVYELKFPDKFFERFEDRK